MPNKKEVQKLLRQIEHWKGWRLERRKRGWMAYPPDKSKSPITIHETYSDHRSLQNTISQLRRAGGDL